MSETKDKLKNLGDLTSGELERISAFIESNYIPKEEHEKIVDFIDKNFSGLSNSRDEIIHKLRKGNEEKENTIVYFKGIMLNEINKVEGSVIEIQKLKEENWRLKKQLPGLLKLQRESCAEGWRNAERDNLIEIILNAPEPSIADLNKE